MSERKPSSDVEVAALADGPFVDDAERAESEWLLAREASASVPAPSSRISSDYAELEDLLATLPTGAADDSWHEKVLKAATASTLPSRPRRRRGTVSRWVMGGVFVAAAAVVVWALIPRAPAAELEVVIRHGPGATPRDSSEAVVGDHLVVTARAHGPGDLRVYRSDDKLIARCPDGPGCKPPAHGEYIIEVTFDAPARYQVLFVVGVVDTPLGGTMDTYMAAVGAAKAHIVLHPSIDVR